MKIYMLRGFFVSGTLHLVLLLMVFAITRTEVKAPKLDISFLFIEAQGGTHSGPSRITPEPLTDDSTTLPYKQSEKVKQTVPSPDENTGKSAASETPFVVSDLHTASTESSEGKDEVLSSDETVAKVYDAENGVRSSGVSPENMTSLSSVNSSGIEFAGVSSSEGFRTNGQEGGASSGFSIEGFINHIESMKWYPHTARKKGIEGKVLLRLKLDKYGELIYVNIKKSSGYAILDAAAVSLLKKSCPFRHGKEKDLSIDVPVTYALVKQGGR